MSNNFSTKFRVYYEDTDAGKIVYYANYLKYAERARTEFLRSLNINQIDLLEKENLVFVVRKCEVNYLLPAKLDDLLEVTIAVKKISPASINFYQEIKLAEKLLTTFNVEIVCVDSEKMQPRKIPQSIKNILNV